MSDLANNLMTQSMARSLCDRQLLVIRMTQKYDK